MVQILENQKQQNFCFSTEKRVSRPHPSLVGFRNLLWHERIHTLKKENNNNKKTLKNSGAKSFELLCLALCKQALPAHPLLAIHSPSAGWPSSPRYPNNSCVGMPSSAKPVLEHQWILALPPTPTPLAGAISSVSREATGSAVFTDLRENSMGQLPAAIYKSVISYFWLLPKKTSTAALC